jgi:hypothetical protein
MTTAPLVYDPAFRASTPAGRLNSARSPVRRSLFLRIIDAMTASSRRRADREIARFIERNGGTLTDDLERSIERSFR